MRGVDIAAVVFGVLMTQSIGDDIGSGPYVWPDMFVADLLIAGGISLFIVGSIRRGRRP
jgi:hypothetical protein